jgi:putative aminopeptidase FrvX
MNNKNNRLQKLTEILSKQSHTYEQFRTFRYVVTYAAKLGCSYYVKDGNVYITKGDADYFPCVVAHMDTVHEIVENLTPVNLNGRIFGMNLVTMELAGIGGDDKVGIFIALQCLEKFENIKIAFFRDEEYGCIGSYECDNDFFDNVGYVLQCDRQGNSDFITSISSVKLSSKAFQKTIKPILKNHSYNFANGGMTDVLALKENGISCSVANMSCGYYNPHSENEYVSIKDTFDCLDMVIEIIEFLGCNLFAHTPEISGRKYGRANNSYTRTWQNWELDNWGKDDKPKINQLQECDCCGNPTHIDSLLYATEYNCDLCYECYDSYVAELETDEENDKEKNWVG